MTIIDLDGAPSEEDCAQLGRTPGFERLNRLELACYEAALVARHGAPPTGRAFRVWSNAHDFGTYRTLALEIDKGAGGLARVYEYAVEVGLRHWLNAGFRAPVEYAGSVAVHVRELDVVIAGALAVTRPGPDGRFPLADFAVIHVNLAAAYPAIAARFRQRFQGEAA